MRARGQALVELALVAPVLIVLAVAAWDGGSVLREQVILDQAARDGARAAATVYRDASTQVLATITDRVTTAVANSTQDLGGVTFAISYPDAQSVQVTVQHSHTLFTPVLRQLWNGSSVTLSARAVFYLPQLTATPAPVTPATATPTPTPNPTATPTPTAIPTATPTATSVPATATPTPPNPCSASFSLFIENNTGYWCTVTLGSRDYISATWSVSKQNDSVSVYTGIPTALSPTPTPTSPSAVTPAPTPTPSYRSGSSPPTTNLVAQATSPTNGAYAVCTPAEPAGTYTVYFWNQGSPQLTSVRISTSTTGC